jgi:hypothetical protein
MPDRRPRRRPRTRRRPITPQTRVRELRGVRLSLASETRATLQPRARPRGQKVLRSSILSGSDARIGVVITAVSPGSKGCSATPSQRNIERSALHTAADAAGLRVDDGRLTFHDLRHTFASHLIIDLSLDVVQVSRLMGTRGWASLVEHMRVDSQRRARRPRRKYQWGLIPTAHDSDLTRPDIGAQQVATRRTGGRPHSGTRDHRKLVWPRDRLCPRLSGLRVSSGPVRKI